MKLELKLTKHGAGMRPRIAEPGAVLVRLYGRDGLSLDEIAEMFHVTRQAVTYLAKKFGMGLHEPGRPPTLLGRVRKMGFEAVEDYFRANPTKTFGAMSKELKVSTSTVQRYYDDFIGTFCEVSKELTTGKGG